MWTVPAISQKKKKKWSRVLKIREQHFHRSTLSILFQGVLYSTAKSRHHLPNAGLLINLQISCMLPGVELLLSPGRLVLPARVASSTSLTYICATSAVLHHGGFSRSSLNSSCSNLEIVSGPASSFSSCHQHC